jgi:hypothetical protein
MMIISIIACIYGIIAIANFGSNTKIYKALKEKLNYLESYGGTSTNFDYLRRLADLTYEDYEELYQDVTDSISLYNIEELDSTEGTSTSIIGKLKTIENSLGIVLFIFPIIFLVVEIVFLVFSCGNKEFTPLPETTFNALNAIKIICLIFSIILIILSILYGALLALALMQYMILVINIDSCLIRIIIGMIFGYYCFWFYITISCGLCKERSLFKLVGSVEHPGTAAKFDANGNLINAVVQIQPVQPVQPIAHSNRKKVSNRVIPKTQNQSVYQPLSLNSKSKVEQNVEIRGKKKRHSTKKVKVNK